MKHFFAHRELGLGIVYPYYVILSVTTNSIAIFYYSFISFISFKR